MLELGEEHPRWLNVQPFEGVMAVFYLFLFFYYMFIEGYNTIQGSTKEFPVFCVA